MEEYNGLFSSSSDDEIAEYIRITAQLMLENEAESSRVGGNKRRYIVRDRVGAGERLMQDYFNETPTYTSEMFRRRFRMRRELFMRIVEGISTYSQEPLPKHFTYFLQRPDARGVLGFTVIQKCTAAIRQLAYGNAPDALDDYLQMSEKTARICLDNFCKCIFDLYSDTYLRKPTFDDIQRLYAKHAEIHGFPGMLGSLDCMHWNWKNCPIEWQGQYTRGDHKHPTVMLEAVASYDLWIWHAFFGVAGSNNDINVLNHSPLFNDIINDTAPETPFEVNGVTYKMGYYLTDGIYPEWATFVKSFTCPQDDKRKKFKKAQESARKDVERAFGVLQARWAIVKNPARAYSVNKLRRIMYTCIILHNMIIEDQGYAISPVDEGLDFRVDNPQPSVADRFTSQVQNVRALRDKETHINLRSDLVEHIWRLPIPFQA